MANPTVEKLKEAGLLYGDKAAVALTSVLFVVCLGAALSMQSIQLTPDEVKKRAQAADTNLNRRRERDDIIKVLETGGIKPTNFSKEVQDAAKMVLLADNYKPEREWVTPEPGAGLIRDTPVLIAPTDLYAYPGRGGALVYDLDENGNRKPDTEKKDVPKEEPRRGRRRQRAGGMAGMMGGRPSRKGSRKSQADLEKEQQEEVEQKKKELAAKLVADNDEPPSTKDEAAKKDNQAPEARSNVSRRSQRDCAGSPSPACSTTASWSQTTAWRSRTPLLPIRTTPGWNSSGNHARETVRGRGGRKSIPRRTSRSSITFPRRTKS